MMMMDGVRILFNDDNIIFILTMMIMLVRLMSMISISMSMIDEYEYGEYEYGDKISIILHFYYCHDCDHFGRYHRFVAIVLIVAAADPTIRHIVLSNL